MDFGVVSFDGLVGSDSGNNTSGFASVVTTTPVTCSDPDTKHKLYGSGFLKQERSAATSLQDDYWRSSKLFRTCTPDTTTDSFSSSSLLFQHRNNNTSLKPNNSSFFFSDGQQQHSPMLSFSCPNKSDAQNATFPYFHLSSSAHNRTTSGYNSGSYNGTSVHGVFAETRGLFTEQQWLELQHQALIYKYITANVPIPSNLLIPIRKALESAGFSNFSGGLLRPNTLAWGPFHLGFSGNTDPEPGRCRRTDGKKWRCSRDAVVDQKYCERHMNRGRHRSRKPVEGQSGHSAAATKPMPTTTTSSSMAAASAVGPRSRGGTSSSLAIAQQQYKGLQTATSSNLSAATSLGRMFLDKDCVRERMHDPMGLSMLSPKIDLKAKENGFGLVSSDSLVNPSQRSSSLVSCRAFGSSQDLTGHDNVSQHSLRQFMDDWPKSESDRAGGSWPEHDHVQSDRTQLSISIPVAPADFMSCTSSPNHDKVNLSPLRLSRELDPIQMGLGVGNVLNESSQRQANWIPISWESSMGGPLGEVLHNTANNGNAECKSSSGLNLMTEGWDSSPRLNSSPTGVLQKTTFRSLSNSSAGSSPRADNNNNNNNNNNNKGNGVSLCKDLAGSSVVQSSSLPAL